MQTGRPHRQDLARAMGLALVVFGVNATAQSMTMSHSVSTSITPANSVACTTTMGPQYSRTNSYWRSYTLSFFGITTDIRIDSITFGIETATAGLGAGSQPLEIRLYTDASPPDPAPVAGLVQVALEAFPQTDDMLNLVTIAITTPVVIMASQTLVVELFQPDGLTPQNLFFMGSNSAGESGPSYISSPDCTIPEPVTTSFIGFPQVHFVLDVNYTPLPAPTCMLTTPAATASGNISMDCNAMSMAAPTVDITFEYSTDAGASFALCARSLISPVANPALARPVGITTFIWDSVSDGVGLTMVAAVVLRATVDDGVSRLPGMCQTTLNVDNRSMTTPCTGICGDCNGDTMGPNILDALVAARIAAGVTMATMTQRGCCDVNSSGLIEVLDALRMAQRGAGLAATIMCP